MAIDRSLQRLENAGLIRQMQIEPELEYIFRHALVQDASYESLLKADRRILHAAVARIVEEQYERRLDELSPILAYHYEKAENFTKAFQYYLRAGRGAAKTYANIEAEALFAGAIDNALAHPEGIPLTEIGDAFIEHGRVLELMNRHEDAIEVYRQMQAEGIRQREKKMELSALIAQAIIQATPSSVSNLDHAQALSEQALPIAKELMDRDTESRVYWILSLVNYFGDKNEKSIEYGVKSLAIAREINNPERIAFTLNDIARAYSAMGRFAEAESAIVESRGLWEQLGNLPMLTDNLTSHAESKMLGGDYSQALELITRAYQLAKKINNDWGKGYALSLQASLHWFQGDTLLALQALDGILENPSGNPPPFLTISQAQLRLEIFNEIGLFDKALENTKIMESIPAELGATFSVLYEVSVAYTAARSGDFETAAAFLAKLTPARDAEANYSTFIPLYRRTVEYLLGMAAKQYDEVESKLSHSLEQLQQAGIKVFMSLLTYWRGTARFQKGDLDSAFADFSSALELGESMNTRHTLWRIHAALALIHSKKGDSAAQTFHSQRARETIQYIAERMPAEYRETYLSQPEIKLALTE